MSTTSACRLIGAVLLMVPLFFSLTAIRAQTQATESQTGLVRYDSNSRRFISDRQLSRLINSAVPSTTQRLLIFAQCFGGEFVASSHFNTANTATAAGTTANQPAHYGGYHEGAAQGLRPGTGRTGQTVHNGGVATRFQAGPTYNETPTTGGGLALSSFSLEPVTANGNVRSRHIVVYVGKPDSKLRRSRTTASPVLDAQGKTQQVNDVADRDAIEKAFTGQTNTTVHTVGGAPDPNNPLAGTGGWDFPGSFDGLARAMQQVKQAIAASADPSKEQFILFVGNHGDYRKAKQSGTSVAPSARSSVSSNFETLTLTNSTAFAMLGDPGNTPAFGFFVPFDELNIQVNRDAQGNYMPFHALGDFSMELIPGQGSRVVLTNFLEQFIDDGDDVLGNQPGEGLLFRFGIDEATFFNRFTGGAPIEVAITNNNPFTVTVGEVVQSTGAIARGPYPPEQDSDADGLGDIAELGIGSNPLNSDSDGDGLDDFAEVMQGRDPTVNEAAALIGVINSILH